MDEQTVTAFAGPRRIATGTRTDVAVTIRSSDSQGPPILVFDDATGVQIDLDMRAEPAPCEEPRDQRGPGRPKLGVVGREVTLLPRHWEWLNAQPGGASVALRKLVEQARRDNAGKDRVRQSQEAAFKFMSAMAGNEPGFEEASRALYAGDRQSFERLTGEWPEDVRDYAWTLAAGVFESA